jgi:hypothetical protein
VRLPEKWNWPRASEPETYDEFATVLVSNASNLPPNPAKSYKIKTLAKLGPVAQRLEQRTHNPLVPGSNPGGPTNNCFDLKHIRLRLLNVVNRCITFCHTSFYCGFQVLNVNRPEVMTTLPLVSRVKPRLSDLYAPGVIC